MYIMYYTWFILNISEKSWELLSNPPAFVGMAALPKQVITFSSLFSAWPLAQKLLAQMNRWNLWLGFPICN